MMKTTNHRTATSQDTATSPLVAKAERLLKGARAIMPPDFMEDVELAIDRGRIGIEKLLKASLSKWIRAYLHKRAVLEASQRPWIIPKSGEVLRKLYDHMTADELRSEALKMEQKRKEIHDDDTIHCKEKNRRMNLACNRLNCILDYIRMFRREEFEFDKFGRVMLTNQEARE